MLAKDSMGDVRSEARAIFEKLIKDSDSDVAEANTGNSDDVTITNGELSNYIKDNNRDLYKMFEHHCAGNSNETSLIPLIVKHYPNQRVARFKHSGPNPEGSVAGVVYADGHDSSARKWLLAFDTSRRKIYVEAGSMGLVDWDEIKVKLDQSGSRSEYTDPIFGGVTEGVISDRGNRVIVLFFL
ncbi:hypothetical protein RND81_09G110300 [Saponaria officinalis]|uniref:Uncharacterized protein n=1 Tax=Saponaria officinalis TaxID=3572 RepID=A0AAW1IK78_SAPOF